MSTGSSRTWASPYAERLYLLEPDPDAAAEGGWGQVGEDAWTQFNAPFGVPETTAAKVEDAQVPGPHGAIPVRIYSPLVDEPSGIGVVWMHGGGFMHGDLDMPEADAVARGLVHRTGGVVVSVDYRLANDGVHFPVPHDDCYAAYEWLRETGGALGVDPERIAVGGASAGANLAAGVALRARDEEVPPALVLLAYPVVHTELPTPSAELAEALVMTPLALRFSPAVVRGMNENYLGMPVESAPGYSFPGNAADLSGYPRTYIENDEFDDLRASGEEFARQLREAGVDVEMEMASVVPHGHLNAVGSPWAVATLDRFAAQLERM